MSDFYEEHGIHFVRIDLRPRMGSQYLIGYKEHTFSIDTGYTAPVPVGFERIKEQSQEYYQAYAELLEIFDYQTIEDLTRHTYFAGKIIYGDEGIDNSSIQNILDNYLILDKIKKKMLDNCEWVYLVGNKDEGKYKIGMTTRTPTQRINEFSPNLPFETEILAQCPTTDAYKLENKLHAMFDDKRTNGEWFELSDGDVIYIRSMSI